GSGLVEQQQPRPRGQCPGNLGTPAICVGEAVSRVLESRLQAFAEKVDGRMDLGLGGSFGPYRSRPEDRGPQHAAASPVVRTEQDVFPHGELWDDADVLEGTGDPMKGDSMRRQT